MANKVLSIKLKEEDLNNLKKYYETLVSLGFISKEKLTMNGFLKHLIIDNLSIDFETMLQSYSEYALDPQRIHPEEIGEGGNVDIRNIYNMDEKIFQMYKQCYKQKLERNLCEFERDVKILRDITGLDIFVEDKGWNSAIELLPIEIKNKSQEFWIDIAMEMYSVKKNYNNLKEYDIETIMEADIADEEKEKLISYIEKKEQEKQENLNLLKNIHK